MELFGETRIARCAKSHGAIDALEGTDYRSPFY